MEKFYTQKQLMEVFGVSRYTIYRATKSGALPVAKTDGRKNLYSEADVLRYIEQSSKGKIANQ